MAENPRKTPVEEREFEKGTRGLYNWMGGLSHKITTILTKTTSAGLISDKDIDDKLKDELRIFWKLKIYFESISGVN